MSIAKDGRVAGYSQGVSGDGAAILSDGIPMTPEEIVAALCLAADLQNNGHALAARWRDITDKYREVANALGRGNPRAEQMITMTGLYIEHIEELEALFSGVVFVVPPGHEGAGEFKQEAG